MPSADPVRPSAGARHDRPLFQILLRWAMTGSQMLRSNAARTHTFPSIWTDHRLRGNRLCETTRAIQDSWNRYAVRSGCDTTAGAPRKLRRMDSAVHRLPWHASSRRPRAQSHRIVLSGLATEGHVSASTQNQALCAVLFLSTSALCRNCSVIACEAQLTGCEVALPASLAANAGSRSLQRLRELGFVQRL